MQKVADYVRRAKAELGDPHMSDRELGERLDEDKPLKPSSISNARYGYMTTPICLKIAKVLKIPPGELLWAAHIERERDPVLRMHLEAWAREVGKAMAAVPSKAARLFAGGAVALWLMFSPAHDAQAFGGAGRLR